MSIFINNNEMMVDKINEIISKKKGCKISIVNDKLTLSVFSILSKNLKNVKEINLILRNSSVLFHKEEMEREFEIDIKDALYNTYDIKQKNTLEHFEKARQMYDFIENNVSIRKVNKDFVVRGNVLIIDDEFMISGSSSLEMNYRNNREINFDTMIQGTENIEQIRGLKTAFETLWYDPIKTSEYKQEVLQSLSYVFKDHSAEFMYYFTLNELFGSQLDLSIERLDRDPTNFKQSKIWKALFNFQKDCVWSAIQKLNKYGGCIIADSVGLGKTFEALAVIKYYEMRMDNVLVLTPAKLYDNWMSFKGAYTDSLIGEDFNYKIMFHTDLNRVRGESKSGYDISRFDWSRYDLVVIDESHNFRNRTEKEIDEEGFTRYQRLLEEVIKKKKTKVLLLSATPVNNSLVDLKNQISLITADNDGAFCSEGIQSVSNTLRIASTIVNSWDKMPNRNKAELFDKLPSDFYKLLEILSISRSRKHITTYYQTNEIGTFPDKLKPDTFTPDIDVQKKLLKVEDTNELLECLKLSLYTPMQYIKSEYKQYYRDLYKTVHKGKDTFFQEDRELYSKGMHRFNLFKRLESSVFAFGETIRRLLEKINKNIEILSRVETYEFNNDTMDDDGESLDYKLDIKVAHLRKADYIEDLEYDKEILDLVYNDIKKVLETNRDEKIAKLREIIANKVKTTPYNVGNKKVLIFSAFADTATYIFERIKDLLTELDVAGACVVGSGNPQVFNIKITNPTFGDVLRRFSPKSKGISFDKEIDIVIGTDCISEGQNLQDCDCVINYDINWNPVTLIQRFGRIDRIGSKNMQIKMINFFPNMELNEYLNLEKRVKNKMLLTNLASTGGEDFLNPELNDIDFRRRQLERLKNEVIDIDEASDNISLTDLNMNEYLYELSQYVKTNKELKETPKGVFSITDDANANGVIFCFKHTENVSKPKNDSSLYPYYLVYVDNQGKIKVGNDSPRNLLKKYRSMTLGKNEPNKKLIESFMKETKNTKDMSFYSSLLNKAIASIQGTESKKAEQTIFDFGGYQNNFDCAITEDFELISFLIVK